MVQELVGAYAQAKGAGAKVVVIKGEGRAFCAGGDVASVREAAISGGTLQNSFFYDGELAPGRAVVVWRKGTGADRWTW